MEALASPRNIILPCGLCHLLGFDFSGYEPWKTNLHSWYFPQVVLLPGAFLTNILIRFHFADLGAIKDVLKPLGSMGCRRGERARWLYARV